VSVAGALRRKSAEGTDEHLLARVQEGDLDAVAALFDRYARLVLGIGTRILRDPGEAEDLVQEFFLRLCQKAHTFDPAKGSARTWMIQVAYRQAVARRSYLMKRSFYSGTDLNAVENAMQGELDIEEHVATQLTGGQLLESLNMLNEKQQATLRLFFFEGCELREIAERLGESFDNVRHYYYRGLDRLRKTAIELGVQMR